MSQGLLHIYGVPLWGLKLSRRGCCLGPSTSLADVSDEELVCRDQLKWRSPQTLYLVHRSRTADTCWVQKAAWHLSTNHEDWAAPPTRNGSVQAVLSGTSHCPGLQSDCPHQLPFAPGAEPSPTSSASSYPTCQTARLATATGPRKDLAFSTLLPTQMDSVKRIMYTCFGDF